METKKQTKIIRGLYLGADRMKKRRDGVWEIKKSFFYRHGNNPELLAEKAKAELAENGIQVEILKTREHWYPWPRESYFQVDFKVI